MLAESCDMCRGATSVPFCLQDSGSGSCLEPESLATCNVVRLGRLGSSTKNRNIFSTFCFVTSL